MSSNWFDELATFFDLRAATLAKSGPTTEELCFVSGREPRIWLDNAIVGDLTQSLLDLTGSRAGATLLEVGCAAGFLARLLAPHLGSYTGVDISPNAVRAAGLLNLKNASFRVASGERLPFEDAAFDAAICYDVVTNFPSFDPIPPIVREMMRVTKVGGKILIGSVPDAAVKAEFERRVAEVTADLERRHGPLPPAPAVSPRIGPAAWLRRFTTPKSETTPRIVCYYFTKAMFSGLAQDLGVPVDIVDVHQRNPYFGFRFNAVYTKTRP